MDAKTSLPCEAKRLSTVAAASSQGSRGGTSPATIRVRGFGGGATGFCTKTLLGSLLLKTFLKKRASLSKGPVFFPSIA